MPWGGWLVAGLLGFAGSAAATELRMTTTYYKVSGNTHAEIRASVRRNGPRGGFAYGIGYIDFLPSYKVRADSGLCRIAEAEVGLKVDLQLPKWEDPGGAKPAARNFATHFVRTIEAHEMQHVAIARSYARTMAQRLRKLSSNDGCWSLRTEARRLIDDLKAAHRAAQRAFDDRTRNQIRRLL